MGRAQMRGPIDVAPRSAYKLRWLLPTDGGGPHVVAVHASPDALLVWIVNGRAGLLCGLGRTGWVPSMPSSSFARHGEQHRPCAAVSTGPALETTKAQLWHVAARRRRDEVRRHCLLPFC